LNIDAIHYDALTVGSLAYVHLAEHFLGYVAHLTNTLNGVDTSMESCFFEIAGGASLSFDLGLDHELARGVVGAERASDIESLL